MTAPTPPEVQEARVVEEVGQTVLNVLLNLRTDKGPYSGEAALEVAAAAVAAYRAAQDGGAEEAVRRVEALEAPSGFRNRPVDLTPAGPGQEVCGERFGRYGVCDLPTGHPPIAEAMGWLHSQDVL